MKNISSFAMNIVVSQGVTDGLVGSGCGLLVEDVFPMFEIPIKFGQI